MKRYTHSNEEIFAMSNVRGKYVKVAKIPFSFYYSVRNSNHGPRVKVTMDAEKLRPMRMSSMKLCDDWYLDKNEQDSEISGKDENQMKEFFRKYLILFLIVWSDLISEPELADFMEGRIDLHQFIEDTDFYEEYKESLDKIDSVEAFEDFCRINELVNFYGN